VNAFALGESADSWFNQGAVLLFLWAGWRFCHVHFTNLLHIASDNHKPKAHFFANF
jgi:hypothetical protein